MWSGGWGPCCVVLVGFGAGCVAGAGSAGDAGQHIGASGQAVGAGGGGSTTRSRARCGGLDEGCREAVTVGVIQDLKPK